MRGRRRGHCGDDLLPVSGGCLHRRSPSRSRGRGRRFARRRWSGRRGRACRPGISGGGPGGLLTPPRPRRGCRRDPRCLFEGRRRDTPVGARYSPKHRRASASPHSPVVTPALAAAIEAGMTLSPFCAALRATVGQRLFHRGLVAVRAPCGSGGRSGPASTVGSTTMIAVWPGQVSGEWARRCSRYLLTPTTWSHRSRSGRGGRHWLSTKAGFHVVDGADRAAHARRSWPARARAPSFSSFTLP